MRLTARHHELLNEVVFQTESVRVGRFRCPVGYREFAHCGRPRSHLVAFPRSSVWIHSTRSRPFVADAAVATVYNPGDEFERSPISPDGDRCEYFGVSEDIAVAIAQDLEPAGLRVSDREVFAIAYMPVELSLYAHQRAIYAGIRRGEIEPLEAEEQVIAIVAATITGRGARRAQAPASRGTDEVHEDLAMRAKAALSRDLAESVSVTALAKELGASPYHLCRIFRRRAGTTLHRYRLELRVRAAMERIARPGTDLSEIALELGFSSHSHFTTVIRRRLGMPPSAARSLLRTDAPPGSAALPHDQG
jgi:AraC-like DNA-binding protein